LEYYDIIENIKMIESIGWLVVAVIVMYLGKVIGKKIWPEDWEN